MKLSVGDVLAESWDLYTRHAGRLITIAVIVFAFIAAVQAAVGSTGQRALIAVSLAVTIVGAYWLQGALVVAVEDLRNRDRSLSITEVFHRVEPRLWPLIGSGVLAALGIVLGLALFVLPGLILITLWSLIVPAVVLERTGVFRAFGRSQELVQGNFIRVFVVILITVVLATVVSTVIRALLTPLPDFFDVYASGVIASSVTFPYVALVWTLMYFDLRSIKG